MPPQRERNNNNNNDMPPGMQQMLEAQMQAQTQFFQTLTSMMNNNNNDNGHNNNNPSPPPPPHVDMLTRFLRLRPSTFSSSSKPIVADNWLCSVNKKLVTIGCTNVEKVRFAAHLLEGPASSWWENYQITHPIEEVNWNLFQEAFCTTHISSGVMSLKKMKFRNFHQGHRTVAEYIEDFNKLARYAPDDVDTDAKSRERFLDGLNDELAVQLSVVYAPNYQALLDKATILENKHSQMESCKRNHNHHHGGDAHHGNGKKHHGNTFNNGSSRSQACHLNKDISLVEFFKCHHMGHYSWGSPEKKIGSGSFNGINDQNHSNSDKRDISEVECYICKKLGHYSWDCPKNKDTAGNSKGDKPNPFKKRHVNYVNVEEVFEAPNAANSKP
jgi:hypothetical protein